MCHVNNSPTIEIQTLERAMKLLTPDHTERRCLKIFIIQLISFRVNLYIDFTVRT